jgi:NAD(P)-dependent dehydrogenase (short-subunit alcohol dehydrogenase family)
MQEAGPIFKENADGGVYLMTSSIAVSNGTVIKPLWILICLVQGVSTMGSSVGYSVTKAAALHLMKSLASSSGPKLRINAILPGLLLTEWVSSLSSVR